MMNGNLIGNRYEIVETIGKGGMSIVYKAKCHLLNRYVALKVLRPEYREDKDFINRFKVEAQSAGSLSHQNIVSIHDVVHDEEQDYIVMEYVEGVTLKQYLEAQGAIPWREAVDYAAQICAGLDHAHKKGIIHKDIKPHNVMITREGVLKITDFGIAKVMSSSTITTGNATMGSVHYFSPEQARGGYIDYQTDIYSLGVVLYEMVTGQLPFEGDTAIAIAMQHIEKEPILPTVLNPALPKSLENVIMRAMNKNQRLRYDSVNRMLVDLKKVYTGHPVEFDANEILRKEKENKQEQEEVVIVDSPQEISKKPASDQPNKKKDLLGIIAGVATGLVLMTVLFFAGYHFVGSSGVEKLELPDFVNMTVEEAEAMVVNTKLTIEVLKEEKSDKVAPGRIIEQNPVAGKMVKEDSVVKVVISEGEEDFPMPDLLNRNKEDAEKILREKDLVFSLVNEPSETIPENYVVRQTPDAGTYVDKATTVTVYISIGKEDKTVDVPNMLGLSIDEAKTTLLDAGLNWGQIVEVDSNKAKGTVISQSIRAGIGVKEKTSIDLRISSGKENKPTPTPAASPTPAPTQAPTAPPASTPAPTAPPTQAPSNNVNPAQATAKPSSSGIVIGPPNAVAE